MTSDNCKAKALLAQMTLAEKVGQMSQASGAGGHIPEHLSTAVREGRVGSVINEVDVTVNNELQRIAVEETRLGIPLLMGRDVIHGFRTIFPIPLGQAASWSTDVVEQGARIAAIEARKQGINWTFAPMIDISRDPRWGRIAESLGEDPYLCAVLGGAMVKGFQTDNLANPTAIAACAKHFVGYGASESGRDYNTANIPENELRNVYLPPFRYAAKCGVATFMTSFSDLNGVPASGNTWLTKTLLRDEWQYKGFVVSDWESIEGLSTHGLTANNKQSALLAARAQVDMEMVSPCYADHLSELIDEGLLSVEHVDTMVLRILETKYAMGLFDNPEQSSGASLDIPEQHLHYAKDAALKSCVLLKNHNQCLPLDASSLTHLAVIGPLADDGYEQLGTWIFDGKESDSVTCLQGIKQLAGAKTTVNFCRAMKNSRSQTIDEPEHIMQIAKQSDAIVLVLGEESILSGEAHCRSNLDLPGVQHELIDRVSKTGKPIILVVMAGRPLTLQPILDKVDAILYAWHPGTMGGIAISELLFGMVSPSGKLPVTFPRVVGQIPLYYAQKPTGRPASNHTFVHQDEIAERAAQTSLGMTAIHLDTHFSPLFPFGFGLSYAYFTYTDLTLNSTTLSAETPLSIAITVTNTSHIDADEIVQLYIRDRVASVTRPVRELKGFNRVSLKAGEAKRVEFTLCADDLGFYGIDNRFSYEKGSFDLWVAGCSETGLHAEIKLV